MYQTHDGAVPHMMFLDQIMVLDLINMWNFTLDIIISLRLSKNQKNLKNVPNNPEKPRKPSKTQKIAARVAENSKGDRRCLEEICAR